MIFINTSSAISLLCAKFLAKLGLVCVCRCRVYLSVKTVNFNILKTLNFVFDCRIWFVYIVLLLIFSFLIIMLD